MKATLPSNNRRESLQIDLGEPEIGGSKSLNGELGFKAALEINVLNWPNFGDVGGPYQSQLRIAGLWLPVRALGELHRAIVAWLTLPMDKLATAHLDREFELAGRLGQSLRLHFGEHHLGHLSISIDVNAEIQSRVKLSTDQSCLQQFAAELDTAIVDHL
jgi:hypothetical protein